MNKAGGFLKRTLVSDLIFDKRELVQVDVKDSLDQVLQVLKNYNILSVPVYDSKKCQYVGMIDTADIMAMVTLGSFFKENKEVAPEKKIVADLLDSVERTKSIYISEPYDSLHAVLDPMGTMGLHRVLVRQKDDYTGRSTFRVLSQTDIIRYLLKHEDECDVLKRKVDEWGLGFEVGKIPTLIEGSVNNTAFELFQKMWTENVSALPIVDENGKCVATLSPSDLRGIQIENMKSVLLPVMEFLKLMGIEKKPSFPVTCGPKAVMRDVLLKAVAAKVHRVWVVNEAVKPVGVVSYTDVLAKLMEEDRR